MRHNKILLLLFTLLFSSASAWAQIEVEEDTDVIPNDDEIVVTDLEGNEEVIEFPEAMTYDLDSLLNL